MQPELSPRLRLGMIGGGPGALIGPVHRMAARLDDRWELVAGAFSRDAARNAQAGQACHLAPDRTYPDWRRMLAAEAAMPAGRHLDAVAIVTPNHLHAEQAVAAIEAGFHVLCDKPLAMNVAEGEAVAAALKGGDRCFFLTHTYSGYPMVRRMRAMIAAGLLGEIRLVQLRYAQDWLAVPAEQRGNAQAIWRTDPARAGAGGALGDIGTHAFHLGEFVSGMWVEAILADLTSFGPGRVLDDNAHILLRFAGGARGMLWCSQVAPGRGNDLRIDVYGTLGGISWAQEQPNQLRHAPLGEPMRVLERGGPGPMADAAGLRLPGHHPEGYIEAFARIYADAAEHILAVRDGRGGDPDACLVPGIAAGLDGLRFIAGAIRSSRSGTWCARPEWEEG